MPSMQEEAAANMDAAIAKLLVLSSLGSGPPADRTRDTLIKSQVLYH